MRSPRSRPIAEALALALVLGAGCGGSGGPPITVKIIYGDAAIDAPDATDAAPTDGAGDVSTAGHCCALQLGDGSSPLCGALEMDAAPGVIEACLPPSSRGTYGRWTCGSGPEPPVCSDNGLSCGLGDPCTLVDVGCPGIVQPCAFKPYTPPSG